MPLSIPANGPSTVQPDALETRGNDLLNRLRLPDNPTILPETILSELACLPEPSQLQLRIAILVTAREKYPDHSKIAAALLIELKSAGANDDFDELARELAGKDIPSEAECLLISDALSLAGRHEEASRFLGRSVATHQQSVSLHHNLGVSLQNCKRLPEALDAFRRAVELRPYSDVSLTMAGSVLKEMGRLPEALEFHGAAVRFNPSSHLALYNMGNALQLEGEFKAAADAYTQALALRPDWPELLNNLCTALTRADRHQDALPHLVHLAKIRNNAPQDIARIVLSLRELNRPSEAIELAETLIRQFPENQNYRMLKTACLPRVGRSEEAVLEYRKAIARNPEDIGAYRSLIYVANYLPYEDPRELFNFYKKYSELIEAPLIDRRYSKRPTLPFPRKLRIGYVSGDFCHHPVGTFIKPVLQEHDRNAFEIFCYYNFDREDRVTKTLRALPVNWRDVASMGDTELCELIRADGIDILVDLSGHTTRNRLLTYILTPAPIQVTMIVCMQTTGLKSMDYRMTDAILDPPGATEELHTEKLVRMQTGPLCFEPHPGAPETAPLPVLSGAPFTFGSFNNIAKITPRVLDLWSKVLGTIPEARMQIVADSDELFLRDMQKRGIPKERFIVLRRMPEVQYLAAHASVDLILDTFPFCGLTTTMNALWMGVPSINLTGNTSASRASASLHNRVGLNEFIASTPEEYVQIASHFATHHASLAKIRAGLRETMRSVWADAPAHTRELESHFRRMWLDYSGETPQSPNAPAAPEPTKRSIHKTSDLQPAHAEDSRDPASGKADSIRTSTPAQTVPKSTLKGLLSECIDLVDPVPKLAEAAELLQNSEDPRTMLAGTEAGFIPPGAHWKHLALCAELWTTLDSAADADRCLALINSAPQTSADWAWFARSRLRAGNPLEARAAFSTACEFPDAAPDATLGLACLLTDIGERDTAEALCRKTIGRHPSVWEAYLNLGNLLYRKGEFREALNISKPAVHLSSDPKLYLNLAVYQEKCSEFSAALDSLVKVIELEPNSAAAYLNLGNCFLYLGMPKESVKAYKKAQALAPDSSDIFCNYLHTQNYVPDADPAAVFELHREFARRFEEPLQKEHSQHRNSKDPARRIRVAYVSPDLRAHSVAFFIEPILKHHDRSKFEVIGILSHTWKDAKTESLKALCDGWIDAGGLSDAALAERIREEEIDIAIDLICHSQGSRVLAFARKPAPVQITMIGMQQTTGIDAMDFRVTDAVMDPPGMTERLHSEKLLRLPLAFCFEPPQPAPPIAPLPALETGSITFGSFNNFAKAHLGVLRVWAEVLRKVPNSRLIAVVPEGTAFESAMVAEGISPDRIIVSPRKSHDAYMHMHDQIDFALDCFPFAGLTVSAIAGWMGVPTLTISGTTPSARAGASLMHSLGLEEFIAADTEDFVRRAVALASDLPKLASIRASMRERMTQLTDGDRYVRSFETALRDIWRRWCDGKPLKDSDTTQGV